MSSRRDGRTRPRRPVGTHDLCVRPRHPHIVLFSSPSSSHRPVFVPVIPTSSCRDARSVRPLCQKLQYRDINGDGRPPARYSRASLHRIQSRLVSSRRNVPRPPSPRRPVFVPVIPTSSCRDARECLAGGRPLCQKLQHRDLTGASVVSKVTAS